MGFAGARDLAPFACRYVPLPCARSSRHSPSYTWLRAGVGASRQWHVCCLLGSVQIVLCVSLREQQRVFKHDIGRLQGNVLSTRAF